MQYPRRIMVVGNGGRECALASALLASEEVEQLVITPANWGVLDPPGGQRVLPLVIKADDSAALLAAAREYAVELAVVGPEAPLVSGLADQLNEAGINALGPGRQAARLEGSKAYAKEFMQRHGIPTAACTTFSDAADLLAHVESIDGPIVLKADGLAAGKGVIVCGDREEAQQAAKRLVVDREFGAAADTVLVEERLFGQEISFNCLVAGGEAVLIHPSSDYKPLLDGDRGPNTGGMGNICPTPYATDAVLTEFEQRILAPFMAGLQAEGLDYRGFLFIGTMLTDSGLQVLEFNVRFGDPEAEVVLPLIEADWPALLLAAAQGQLSAAMLNRRAGACVTVMLASQNYPYGKSPPAPIQGLERVYNQGLLTGSPPPVRLYFAGVSREAVQTASAADPPAAGPAPYRNFYDNLGQARYLASGGRVLAVSAQGPDLSAARRLVYEVVGNLHFEGMQYRSDIGQQG